MSADVVADVRSAIAQNNYQQGESILASHKNANGATPDYILALSWLGRGSQAARNWDAAERYSIATRKLCLEALKTRKLDDEPKLPLALGASIEVAAHTMAGRGERAEAVAFLQKELRTWHDTSIRTRIQKNILLLSLEGKPAPPLETSLASLKGKPVVLFFWAHWCSDCKYQGPILAQLEREFGAKGLTIVGPTQRYGYIAAGKDATPEEETKHIDRVRRQFYGMMPDMAVPVSEENFKNFGCSTTPTLVVIDRQGIVRLYHPGKMTYAELLPVIQSVL
jgi:thiol-disulfide isomerase/thioredoxin